MTSDARDSGSFNPSQNWSPSRAGHTPAFDLCGTILFESNLGIEVEIINTETLSRSVVYVKPIVPIYAILPRANYGFFIRPLSSAKDGAEVKFRSLGLVETMWLYIAKVKALWKRSPLSFFKSLGHVSGRFLRPAERRAPVAMRSATSESDTIQPTASQATAVDSVPQVMEAEVLSKDDLARRMRDLGPKVSIIVPTKVRQDLLKALMDSLGLLRGVTFEVIVVDNGATSKEMLSYLTELANKENVKILRRDIAFNFSKLCNEGARVARYPILLFLNDDIEARDGDWLAQMVDRLEMPGVGIVGARLLYPSGLLQHAGVASNLIPAPGHPWRLAPKSIWETHPLLSRTGEVDAVTGACLMIKARDFSDLRGFNEADFAITLNDVDLCLRAREKGLKVIYVPEATLLHKEGQSRRPDDDPVEFDRREKEAAAFLRRHEKAARSSCFYPSNLRRDTDQALPI